MLWGELRVWRSARSITASSTFAVVLTGLVLVLLFGQESAFAVGAVPALPSAAPAAPSNVTVKPYGPLDFYVTWNSHSTNHTGFEIANGATTTTVGPSNTSHLCALPAPPTN